MACVLPDRALLGQDALRQHCSHADQGSGLHIFRTSPCPAKNVLEGMSDKFFHKLWLAGVLVTADPKRFKHPECNVPTTDKVGERCWPPLRVVATSKVPLHCSKCILLIDVLIFGYKSRYIL